MSIGRLGQYDGFYQSYAVREPQRVRVEDAKGQDEAFSQQQRVETLSEDRTASMQQDTRSPSADLGNISLTFNANETFDYIGQDASLENLDMMSAISDMQKDKVLQQYQYFVGAKEFGGVVAATPDGAVIQK